MRKFCIPAIAAASLFALPALAMNGTAKGSSNTTPQATTQPEQQLRQDLTKAGYSDIQIMPGSFLIHAKNKQGDQTEMMISPHSMTEVTAMSTPAARPRPGRPRTGRPRAGRAKACRRTFSQANSLEQAVRVSVPSSAQTGVPES